MNVSSTISKVAVSVSEMARMVGLSRARFYNLIGEVFPHPIYNCRNRRPFFDRELQQICLQIKQQNVDLLGRPFIFREKNGSTQTPQRSNGKAKSSTHADLIQGLRQLGLDASPAQVEAAIAACSDRLHGLTDGERLRTIFRFLKRQQTTGDRQ